MVSSIRTMDGRTLAYVQHGDLDGKAVFVMHGSPGSRIGPLPRATKLYRQGVRMISYDRPGFGGSDRLAGRDVSHAAADVTRIADELGIERFSVVGRSGGAPHALACAALAPERVTRVAALVSFAPYALMGRAWFEGMTDSNILEYTTALSGSAAIEEHLAKKAREIIDDPEAHLPFELADLTRPDRSVMADHGIRAMLLDNFAEALRPGPYGWIDDSLSFVRPWGFDLADVRVPVRLWHGAVDVYSPIAHTRWLAGRIPGASAVEQRGAGHFTAIEALPSILSWLTA